MSNKIISEEKSFKEFLKVIYPIHGVFGYDGYIENGQFVEYGRKFLMFDENLKVIFENEPYNSGGNYHKNVEKKLKEMKVGEDPGFNNLPLSLTHERFRTDNCVDDMILHLLTHHFINWSPWSSLKGEVPEDYDIEPSSPEWENLNRIRSFYSMKRNLLSEKCKDNSLDEKSIDYNLFTEKGKKTIDDAVEWFKTNESRTPLQDAWMAVLRKDGINIDWEPNTFAQDDELIMKNINYETEDEIKERRKIEHEEFKKSLTPEQKSFLRKAAENLSKKKK
jgi:hypothetical protein